MLASTSYGLNCRVCGSEKAGLHYGGNVCSCCRIFFLRQTKRGKQAVCRWNSACTILPGVFDNCQACRYRKCLEANMKPSEVGKQKYTKREKDEIVVKIEETTITVTKRECPSVAHQDPCQETTAVCEYEPNCGDYKPDCWMVSPTRDTLPHLVEANTYFPREMYTSVSAGFMYLKTLGCLQNTTDYVNCLLALQNFINNPEGVDPIDVYANLDVSLADVLLNSQICCSRAAITFDRWTPEPDAEYSFVHTYCRSVTHYADFLTAAPELHNLVEQDKMKLVQYNQMDVCFLFSLFEMWQAKFNSSKLKARSTRFHLKPEDQARIDNMIVNLTGYTEYFLSAMQRLGITAGEVVVLKFIVLFSPPLGISENGLYTIDQARTKYCHILSSYILERNPCISLSDHTERLGELLGMLRMLKEATYFINQMYAYFTVSGSANMNGQLTYDILIRNY